MNSFGDMYGFCRLR